MKGYNNIMKKATKRAIIIILFIFGIILVALLFFIKGVNKNYNNNISNNNEIEINADRNIIDDIDYNNEPNNSNLNIIQDKTEFKGLDVDDTDPLEENRPIQEADLCLERKTDAYSYFAIKQCLSQFYSTKENAINVLDKNLRQYNITNFYEGKNNFRIDNIYKAPIKLTKNIYYVYYRIEVAEGKSINKQMMIKIDTKNASFYVYPYEYLKSINYLDLKQGDKISLDVVDTSEIELTDYNNFNQGKIKKEHIDRVTELFERTKFDFKYDLEHLYNLLDNEYRKIRFSNNYDNFVDFINTNRDKYLNDEFKGYQLFPINNDIQYIAISQTDNHYVFNIINLMNYSVQLDNYTVALPVYSKIYENNMPNVKAKYCINRVMKAINDKNYEFVYAKLNPVQKSNYYQSYNDFVNFVKTYFYEKNTFEYGEYTTISDNVFRYIVNIKDENNDSLVERKFNMTITLKNNADFEISITF